MVYGDFSGPRLRKNKANSKPNKANSPGFARKSEALNPKSEIRRMDAIWKNKANLPGFGRNLEILNPKS